MEVIKQIIKLTAYRYKNAKFATIFLTISFMMAMFLMSMATTFVTQLLRAQEAKEQAMPPHGSQTYLYAPESEWNLTSLMPAFEVLGSGEGAMISELLVHPDRANVNVFCPLIAQYPGADNQWQYPVSEGRSYTKQEIIEGKKLVLIGKELKKYTEERDGRRYISLYGEQYEVIGNIGIKDQVSLWDNRLFLPLTALPEKTKEELNGCAQISMIVYSEKESPKDVLEKMKDAVKDIPSLENSEVTPLVVNDILQDVINSQDYCLLRFS